MLCYRMIFACLQEELYLVDCSFALASCEALHRATVNKLQSLGQLLVEEEVQAAGKQLCSDLCLHRIQRICSAEFIQGEAM